MFLALAATISTSGFAAVTVHGDLERAPFDRGSSPRAVIVAQKRAHHAKTGSASASGVPAVVDEQLDARRRPQSRATASSKPRR